MASARLFLLLVAGVVLGAEIALFLKFGGFPLAYGVS